METEGSPSGDVHSGEELCGSRHNTDAGKTRLSYHPSGAELGPEHVMPAAPTFTQGRPVVYSRFHGLPLRPPNTFAQCFNMQDAHSLPNVSLGALLKSLLRAHKSRRTLCPQK